MRLDMKLYKYFGVVITAVIFMLFTIPFFIKWDSYCSNFIISALENSKYSFNSLGKVSVRLIFPKITVEDLRINSVGGDDNDNSLSGANIFFINKLDLYPSFLSMLKHFPVIKRIIVDKPVLSTKILYDLLKFDSSIITGVNSITVLGATFDSKDFKSDDAVFYLDSLFIKLNSVKQRVSGKFVVDRNEYDFSVLRQIQKQDSYILTSSISSPTVMITLSGDNAKGSFLGKVDIKSNNLRNFLADVSIFDKLSFLKLVKSQEAFSLSSQVILSENNFKAHNFFINSSSFKGDADVNYEKGEFCNINLNLARIDLDSLISFGADKESQKKLIIGNTLSIVPSNLLNVNLKISGKEIYYRGEISKNLNLDARIFNGQINVNKLTVELPGDDNRMNIRGVVTSDAVRSRFNGSLLIEGNDPDYLTEWILRVKVNNSFKKKNNFVLNSYLYIAPRIFSASNLMIKNGNTLIKGNVRIKNIGKKKYVNSDLSFTGIDVNRYSLFDIKNKDDVLPMRWLREVDYDLVLDLKLQNSKLYSENLRSFHSVVRIAKEKLEFANISFLGEDKSNLKGSVKVTIDDRNIKPNLLVRLSGNRYSAKSSNFAEFRQIMTNSSGKIDELKWSAKKINFLGLKNFNGNVDVKLSELVVDGNNSIKDFDFQSDLRDGVMLVNKFYFKHNDGDLNINARLGLGTEASLTAVFTASSFELNDIMRTILGVSVIKGIASFSGSFKTQGNSLLEWFNRLEGEIDIAAVNINIDGINISQFITNLFAIGKKSDVAYLTKIALYEGNTDINTLEGKISISNGNAVISSQFAMDRITASFSASFSCVKFVVDSMFRFFFINPKNHFQSYIDMSMQGLIWNPKINFNIDDLYSIVLSDK